MTKRPHFIIIGAMKCATSTLHDQLNRQQGIFMTEPKEPNFFSNDEQFGRGWDWYASLFGEASQGALCGESSTHYTKLPTYPQTVERMHKHLPDVKLIYVMRDPIRRLISQYIHEWTQRQVNEQIDLAVENRPELTDYSRYAMQLKPFIEVYGFERILPVFFERLIAQPQSELERVCRFIGYEGQPHWDTDHERQNVSADRLRHSPVRDLLVGNALSTWLRRRFVPQAWRDRVKKQWQMTEKVELGAEQVCRLEAVFDEDLVTLGRWLDMDLNCGHFKSTVLENAPSWNANREDSQL